MELVQVMKALGDKTRLRILNILRDGYLNVGEIEKILGVSQSNVSRHLSRLKASKLIIDEKKAQWVYYRLNHSTLNKYPLLKDLIDKELKKIDECIMDIERLRKYRCKKSPKFNAE